MADYVGTTTNPLENTPMGQSSSRTSGSRVSGNTFDPLALSAAMQSGVQLTKAGGDIDVAMAAIAAAGLQRQEAEKAQMAAITDYATKAGELTAAQAAADAKQAERRKSIMDASGVNPDNAESLFHRASNELFSTSTQLETLGADIDKRMAVGMFDNPLEWLINQVRLPGMVGEYNAVAAKQNRALETARTAQGLATTQLALSTNMDADEIQKQGVAKVAADASAAQAKLSEVQVTAANAAARDAANVAAMNRDKFTITLNLAQLTKEKFATGEYASEKEAQQAAEQYRLDKVNEYMARIGSSIRYDVLGFKAMPAAKREALVERAGTPVIAAEFDEAAAIIDAEGSLTRIAEEGDSAAVNWFRGTMQKAQQGIKAAQAAALTVPGGKMLPDDKTRDQLLRASKTQYVLESADMRKADVNNPYKIAYDFMAKQQGMSQFKNNIVTNYINEFGPNSKNPAYTTLDEAVMLDKISTDVMNGKIPAGAAAMQISMFYKTANKLQALRSKYPLFGMDEHGSYNVKLPEASSLFTSTARAGGVVDLTNPAAIEAYLVKDTAAKLKGKLQFDILTSMPM